MSMHVDFAPDQEAFVKEAIKAGRLSRTEDAVHQALSLRESEERKQLEILSAFAESGADVESGNYTDYTDESSSQLIAELKAKAVSPEPELTIRLALAYCDPPPYS